MEEFKKYYKFPLKYDGHGYIWTSDNRMALQSFISDNDTQTIVDILNDRVKKKCNARFEDGYIVINGYKCLLVRGWGMLTGIGAYNLKIDNAAKIQDEFANWCVNKLSH